MEHHQSSESNFVEYLKFIVVLLGIVLVATALFVWTESAGAMEFSRWFMGVFLVVFAGFKLAGYTMFAMMFAGYDLLAKRSKLYAQAYPFIELGLGVMFLANVLFVPRNVAVLLLMGIGAIGVFQEIHHRRSGIYCACLGNIIKLPLSTVSLVENVLMAGMAAVMLLSVL